jgi:hypothetical protein
VSSTVRPRRRSTRVVRRFGLDPACRIRWRSSAVARRRGVLAGRGDRRADPPSAC